MPTRLRRWLPVLLVGFALVAAGVAAAGQGVTGEILPPPEEEVPGVVPEATAGPATPGPEPVDGARRLVETDYPGWLTWPVTILVLGLIAGTIGLFLYVGVRYLLTERVRGDAVDEQAASQPGGRLETEQVRDAVRAGLADLDAGGDPRRAVIACWLRLERAAAAAGTARLAADTPTDLVRRLLAAHRVSDEALGRLADAYRLARYAPAEISGELLSTAERALRDVDAQLGGRVSGQAWR
jgi:hypothetical protein